MGAVGNYLVAKFTPMTPDGEAGEPAYVISETPIESEYILIRSYQLDLVNYPCHYELSKFLTILKLCL